MNERTRWFMAGGTIGRYVGQGRAGEAENRVKEMGRVDEGIVGKTAE